MRHTLSFILQVSGAMSRHQASRSAAALSYFLLLSVFPLLVVISSFVGMLHLDIDSTLQLAERLVPRDSLSLLENYLQYVTDNASTPLLAAGVMGTVTSASAAFRILMVSAAEIYGSNGLHPFLRMVFSVLFSILFLVIMYLSLVVVLTGSWFLQFLTARLQLPEISGLWQQARFLFMFALALLFLACFYRAIVPRDGRWRPVLPGALTTAAALAGGSVLFSWFISLSSRYSLLYGSLASMIILMVWLYLCGQILVLGCVINYVWDCGRQARRRAEG